MKGTLSRRILSTLLSLAMILSMLGMTVLQVSAATNKIYDIRIKDVVRKNSMAADIADEINARRLQLGEGYSELTIDEYLVDDAMVRAAELPIMTSDVDLCFSRYSSDISTGIKRHEAILKTNVSVSAADIVDTLMNSSDYTLTFTDKKVTEMGVGVISLSYDPENVFVCIRTTNELSDMNAVFDMTSAQLRALPDETLVQETKASMDALSVQDPALTNKTTLDMGETIPMLFKVKNYNSNGSYVYLIPDYSIQATDIVRGNSDGTITGLSYGTADIAMMLFGDNSSPYSKHVNVDVLGSSFDGCAFEYKSEYTFRDTPITPELKITEPDGTVLVEGTDYYLTYSSNTKVGTGLITVNGLGKYYKKTKDLEFSINPIPGMDFYISDPTAYPNEKVNITLTGINGVAPYNYSLTVTNPSGTSTMSSNTSGEFSVTPTMTGEYTLTAEIKDFDDVVTKTVKKLNVVERTTVSFKKDKYVGLKGSSVKVEIDSAGGLAPVKYTYEFEDGTTVSKNTSNKYANVSLSVVGERKLIVYATDARNNTVTASTTVVCYSALTIGSTVSDPKIYLGQSTVINATTAGGYGPFVYEFTDSSGNVLESNEETLVFTPEKTGDQTINIKVTDQAGNVKTAKATVSVAAPLEVSLTCTNPDVLLGNYTTIKANVTGGFPTIKYKYEYDDGTPITGTSNTLTYRPQETGSYNIVVTVTDGLGTTDIDTITINAAPKLAVTLDVSDPVVYTGQSVTFTAQGTGGFDPTSYEFEYADGTPIVSNGNKAVVVPEEPGTYYVQVNYLDKNANMASIKKSFIAVAPLDVQLKAKQPRAVVGERVDLVAETVGGYSTITYKYVLEDGTEEGTAVSGTSRTTSYTPKAVGDYTIKVTATDKLNSTVVSRVTFHVEPALKITAYAENPYVNLGDSTTLRAEVEGGYAPMTYSFTMSDGTELGDGSGSAVFIPAQAGSYDITCKATDDAGHVISKKITVKSAEKLTIGFDSTLDEVVAGKTVTFTTTPNGGFPTIKYSYQYSDGTPIPGTSNKLNLTPQKEGDYTIIVTATDLGGNTDTAEKSITVAPKMVLNVNVSDDAIFRGETAEIVATGTGGFPPYTFIYEYLNDDGSTTLIDPDPADQCKANISPDANGDYKVRVTFKDRNDNALTNTKIVRVTDALILSTDVSAKEIFVNDTVTFTTSYSGGFAPVYISYSCTNNGRVTISDKTNGIFKPTKAGIYTVTVQAKDKYSNVVTIDNTIEVVDPLTLKLETQSLYINKGEPFTINAVSTGGFQPVDYSFRFSGSNTPLDSSGDSVQLQLMNTGEYTIFCQAVDRNDYTAEAVLTVTICDPFEVSIDATEKEVLSGTKVTFTASSTGGYGDVTYKFTNNGSSLSSTNGVAVLTPTTAKDYIIAVTATDKAGRTAVADTTLSVANKITATAKVSASQVMVGETVTVTTTAAGGFEPLHYSYAYDDGTEIPSNGGNVAEIRTTRDGTFNVIVTVTDRNNNAVTAKCTFKVIAELDVSVSAPKQHLVIGESVVLTTAVTGGIPSYSYSYKYADGTAISGTSSTYTFKAQSAGTFTIVATAKDKQGTSKSDSITIEVADKMAAELTVPKNTAFIGESLQLTAAATGGFPDYTYSFAYDDGTPIQGTGNKAVFSNNLSGTYKIRVTVSDSKGHSAVAYQTITVSGRLGVTLTPSVNKAVAGTSVKLTTNITGGFAPFKYKYEYADGTAISGTSATTSVTLSKAGYYTVKVTVTDAIGEVQTATTDIEISNKLTLTLPSTTAMVNIGDTYVINANASGGVDALTYTFTYEDGTALESNGNRAAFSPTEPGSTKINVKVEDTVGNKATASMTINAAEKLYVGLDVSETEVTAGTTVNLTASANGGFAPLTYKFTATNGANVTARGATGTSLLTLAGDTDFTVTVTDKAGNTATATRRVKVKTDLNVSFTASAYRIYIGDSITFTAESTGGTAPVTFGFAYSDGTKINSNGNQAVITPEESGSYTVIVTATDKYGNKATDQTRIVVDETSELFNTSTISSDNIPLGSVVRLNGSCTGGSAPYKYDFYYKKSRNSTWLKISTDETSCSLTPTSATNYDIRIVVTDRRNTEVEKTFKVKVEKELENTSTVSSNNIVVGEKIVISGSAVGGAGGYQYAFYYKKSNKETWTVIGTEYTTKYASFRPGTATDYNVMVKVKDLDGTVKEKSFLLNGSQPLSNNSTINAETVVIGNKVVIKGLASGGTAPYKYAFYYKKASKTSWNTIGDPFTAKSAAFRPGSTIPYNVKVEVVDDAGKKVEKIFTVNIVNELKDLENDTTISAEEIVLGDRVVIKGLASGGTAPYQYAFYYKKSKNTDWITLGTEYTTASASFKPTAATNYDVKTIAKDASGKTVVKTFTVVVNSAT